MVVLDDESRENEGDLIMAAETMTTEAMAFMVEYTSGVICVPLEGRQASHSMLCDASHSMLCDASQACIGVGNLQHPISFAEFVETQR